MHAWFTTIILFITYCCALFFGQEPDIRFIRRMQRDISQRNRTADEVVAQFLATVRPMHELFVTPSKVR